MISITITEQSDDILEGQIQKGQIILYFKIIKNGSRIGMYLNMFQKPDLSDHVISYFDLHKCFNYAVENFELIIRKSILAET
jgi:hypothetical protein